MTNGETVLEEVGKGGAEADAGADPTLGQTRGEGIHLLDQLTVAERALAAVIREGELLRRALRGHTHEIVGAVHGHDFNLELFMKLRSRPAF